MLEILDKKNPALGRGKSGGFAYLRIWVLFLFLTFFMIKFGRGERIRTSDPLHPMQVR
jgi:hypothetical protein